MSDSGDEDNQAHRNSELFVVIRAKQLPATIAKNIEECLNNGAQINARNGQGDTILHLAIKNKYEEIVYFLFKKGAKINISNNDNKTPLDLAECNLNLVQILTKSINVPGDGSCLFWAVTLAYLTPVKNDDNLFPEKFERLFGAADLTKKDSVQNFIQIYEPFLNSNDFRNTVVRELVTKTLRHRVVDYMSDLNNRNKFEAFPETLENVYRSNMLVNSWGGDPEIEALSLILNARIKVYSHSSEPQVFPLYNNDHFHRNDTEMKLFHVSMNGDTNVNACNHYEFGVDLNIVDDYLRLVSSHTGSENLFNDSLEQQGTSLKRQSSNNNEDGTPKKMKLDTRYRSYDNEDPNDNEDGASPKKKPKTSYDTRVPYSSSKGLKKFLHGIIYQLKLLMLFVCIGVENNKYEFCLATEMDEAEKFDDLVFECNEVGKEKRYRFLQAKHRQDQSKMITAKDLLSEKDSENNDFSLQKYFYSFRKINKNPKFQDKNNKSQDKNNKSQDKNKDFILCTNVNLDHDTLKQAQIELKPQEEDTFFPRLEGKLSECYKLDINKQHELYEKFRETSDVYMLAKELVKHIIDPRLKLTLNPTIFQYYHVALVQKKVIIKEKNKENKYIGKFSEEFINSDENLRNILQEHLDKLNAKDYINIKNFLETHLSNLQNLPVINKNTELKYLYSVWQDIELWIKKDNCIDKFTEKYITYDNNFKASKDPNNDRELSESVKELWKILQVDLDKIRGLLFGETKETKICILQFIKNLINCNFKLPNNSNNDPGLSDSAKELSKFQEHLVKIKNLSVNNDTELELSEHFGKGPMLTNIKKFIPEFAKLCETHVNKIVTIGSTMEKIVTDNINRLAGYVLISKDEKIQIRELFFDDRNKLPGNLEDFKTGLKNILNTSFTDLSKYQFKIDGDDFKKCEEKQKSDLPNDKIEDGEIIDFINELVLAVNQNDVDELDYFIKEKMGKNSKFNLLNADLVTDSFEIDMLDWLKEKFPKKGEEGRWITSDTVKGFLDSIEQKVNNLITLGLSLAYPEKLAGYGIKFNHENEALINLLFKKDPTRIFNLIASTETLLSSIKVLQTLTRTDLPERYTKKDSYIFIRLKTVLRSDTQDKVIEAFNSPTSYHLLIIDCGPEQDIQELYSRLSSIITDNTDKKIILITKKNKALAKKFETDSTKFKYKSEQDQNSFNDLTPESQKELLKKEVIFQGKLINLNNLINQNDKNVKENIDSETIIKLLKNKSEEIKIGSELKDLGKINYYYITRRINTQVIFNKAKIKNDILESNLISDIFVISGTDSGLADRNNKIYIFDQNNDALAGSKFRELCEQNTGSNIHCLKSESEYLIWYQSKGSISHLVKYRHTDKVDTIDYKTSERGLLEDEYLVENKSQIVIICDTPGMGKSTVLTNLTVKMKENNPSLWVIRIDLNDYTTVFNRELKKRNSNKPSFSNQDVNSVVNFLIDNLLESGNSKLTTNLEKELFKSSVNSHGKIALLFDGFDEISPDYQDVVIEVLQALKKSKVEKLFVTTRPSKRELLEEKLEIFSNVLEPFDNKDQIKFLTKFFTKELELKYLNQERLTTYVDSLIEKFSQSINDKEREFIGIPLQTMMLAKVFQENTEEMQNEWEGCKEFLNADHTHKIPKLPEKFDLLGLYEKFVERKFKEFFLQDKKGRDLTKPGEEESARENYENFKKRHEALALSALLTDKVLKKLLSPTEIQQVNKWIEDIKNGKKNEGILDKIIDNKPHFIHRTFAEYFVAFPLVEKMTLNPETIDPVVNSLVANTSPVFIAQLLNKQKVRIESHTVLDFITRNKKNYLEFFNALLKIDYQDDLDKTSLHYAVQYNCEDTIDDVLKYKHGNLPIDILKHGDFLKKEYENSNLVKFVNKKDNNGKTALDYADTSNLDMILSFELLLNGASIDRLPQEYLRKLTLYMLRSKSIFNMCDPNSIFDGNILDANGNEDNKFRPIQEKLLMVCPEIFSDLNENDQSRLLSYFFIHGRVNVIDILLSSINDEENKRRLLNAVDNGFTPLDHVNCNDELSDDGRLAITKYLLDNGGTKAEQDIGYRSDNTDSSNRYITKILQAAAENGHINTFQFFIDRENPNYYHLHLRQAVENEQFNIIKYLIENHRENIKHAGNTALHSAVKSEASLKMIKYCLDNGDDINAQNDNGETPLSCAVGGKLNVIKYLVKHGADVNIADKNGFTALDRAINNNNQNTKNYLLTKCETKYNSTSTFIPNTVGLRKNSNEFNLNLDDELGMSQLHLAIQSNNLKFVEFLLQEGANINKPDLQGKTPLHWASQLQLNEIVELLLQYGAIFNAHAINNTTPLDLVSQSSNHKIYWLLGVLNKLFSSLHLTIDLNEQLLSAKSGDLKNWGPYGSGDPTYTFDNPMQFILNARNAEGKTLLHIAADTNDQKAIQILLKFNNECLKGKVKYLILHPHYQSTSIDAIDSQGNTPLHLAAQKGYNKMVSLLLGEGAIFNAENLQGNTPETLAHNNYHDSITKILHQTKNLFIAIEQNSLEKVINCINEGACIINAKDKNGKTPLHCAVSCDQIDIVQFLLKKKANIDPIDTHNQTPLHFATENNKLEIVKLLLKNGACYDAKGKQDKAPFEFENNQSVNLLVAINKFFDDIHSDNPQVSINHLEMIHRDYKIDISTIINIRDSLGNTLLHYAAKSNDIDNVKLLLENGACYDAKNKANFTANDFTSSQDIKSIIKSIENMFDDVDNIYQEIKTVDVQIIINVRNGQGRTLLHEAAVFGKLEIVKWLEKHGADVKAVDQHGSTVLHEAAKSGNLKVVQLLITEGADVNAKDILSETALHRSAIYGKLNLVKFLVEKHGADVNAIAENGNTVLHIAANSRKPQFNMLKYLLENHRENIKHAGNTALHTLVYSGASLKIIKYCIDNGEEINVQNHRGETPLFHAINTKRRLNVIKYLVDHEADVNKADKQDNTVLYYALENDQRDVIKYLLLECKAEINLNSELIRNKVEFFKNPKEFNLNLDDEYGMPRLHRAIQSKDLELAKFLIQQGADINKPDQQGKTPLHWASELQLTEMVELLLQYGAIFDAQDNNNSKPLDLLSQSGSNKITWLLGVLNKLFISQNLIKDLNEQLFRNDRSSCDSDNLTLFILYARNVEGKTLLHIAADTNDERSIDILLQFTHDYLQRRAMYQVRNKNNQSTSIDAIDLQKNTPLHLAAQKGYNQIVFLLLKNGAIFDAENLQGQTPEYLANNNHHDNITKLLQQTKNLFISIEQNSLAEAINCINEGACINAKDKNGKTPLHFAACSDQSDIVQFLLENNANIEAIDRHNRTPLHFATENNKVEIVKLLLKNGACFDSKDIQDKAPFEYKNNQSVNLLDAINKLFNDVQSDNPQVNIDYLKMIHRDYEINISTIINIRDSLGNTILHYAAQSNDIGIVELLLENGACYDTKNKANFTANDFTSSQDIKSIIKSIENMFDGVDNIYQQLRTQIDDQIIINVRNGLGRTLLHEAAVFGKLEIVELLVQLGADVNAVDQHEIGVIHEAFKSGNMNVCRYLIEEGADGYAIDEHGMSRLHLAILSNDLKLVKYLLQEGADINKQDRKGKTPLHWASQLQLNEIVELLLQYGAIFNAHDINNTTPLDLVSQSSNNKIYWLLDVLNKLFISQHLTKDLNEQLLSAESDSLKNWGPYGSGDPTYTFHNPMQFILNARNAEGKTLLHIAADTNDQNAIKILLKFNNDCLNGKVKYLILYPHYQSTSIDAIDYQGNTPLHLAAQKGYNQMVSLLLGEGAIFNAENLQGNTPETLAHNNYHDSITKILHQTKNLFIAIEQNSLEKVINCINEDACIINAKDKNGKTPLHCAVSCDQCDIIQFLLKKKANIDPIDTHNQTPLHFATENNKHEIVKLLLKNGAGYDAKDKQDKAPFEFENNQSVNLLVAIKKLFDDIQSDNPQVSINHLEMIHRDYDIDISSIINIRDSQGNTMLHYAAKSNDIDIVKLLLENGACFDAKNKENLTANVFTSRQDIKSIINSVKKMFDDIDNIYQEKKTVDEQIIINVRNGQGRTLLHETAIFGKLDIVKWLVKHGADVKAVDQNGCTVLDNVAKFGNLKVGQWLIAKGADVNVKDKFFKSPNEFNLNLDDVHGMSRLHLAIQSNYLKLVKYLLQEGANINKQDQQGKTPLHWASQLQLNEIVELLLQYGAIFNAHDINNTTPLDLVSQSSNNKIYWLLGVLNKLFISQHLTKDLNEQLLSAESDSLKNWGPYGSGDPTYTFHNPMQFILNARNAEGKTLLHIAADTNDQNAIKILLKFNNDCLNGKVKYLILYPHYQSTSIDAIDSQGNTPLHLAAQKGYNQMVSLLLGEGAIFNGENLQGNTPETLAHNNYHDSITKILHQTKNLFIAIEQNSLEKVINCINEDACIINAKGKNGKTPLHCAVSCDQCDILQFLLKKKANIDPIDTHNQTPLHFATENNKLEIVKLLLKNGAGYDAKDIQDKAPFEFENNQSVNLLVAINKLFNDIQSDNPQVSINHLEMIHRNYEIDISTIINIRDSQGNTLLHYAAKSNDIDIVKLLLENGACFDAENKENYTANIFTNRQDIESIINSIGNMFDDVDNIYQEKKTVDEQIIINVRNGQGRTLLHEAAIFGKLEIVKMLVKHGADVNAVDKHGNTVLHQAVNLEVVQWLVEKGANINALNEDDNKVLNSD